MADEIGTSEIIEESLCRRLGQIGDLLDAEALCYSGPIDLQLAELLKRVVEAMPHKRRKLVVVLETGGGQIEAAERIATVFRHHYRTVDFVVPWYAMSAGTVLVMSGDNIYMDYASTLGPIDPQVKSQPGPMGRWVPALGYLEQYERLVQKSATPPGLTNAEMAYLLQNFDPAEMSLYEHARDLSKVLLEKWLATYKFRSWKETESTGTKVTMKMKRQRAGEIANQLVDTNRWHSHGRGITMEILRKDLKLKIDDFGADKDLRKAISGYANLLQDYRMKRGHFDVVVNWKDGYHGF